MTDQAIDSSQEFKVEKNKRPTFLTVLCILTFVVSGYNFFESAFGLFVTDSFDQSQWTEISEQMSEAMNDVDSESREVIERMMNAASETIVAGMENAMVLGLVEMLAAALSVIGALLMFKLKMGGYYTYILAKLVGVIVPLAILGVNLLTGIIFGFAAFVSIVFIILYGLNAKHLS
ncbi:MAG TPA: hypothetical protein VJ911_03605 [Cryomorphaceae bacterium]|nr:hypothetical protein [Cryomorphaceae bacterium]